MVSKNVVTGYCDLSKINNQFNTRVKIKTRLSEGPRLSSSHVWVRDMDTGECDEQQDLSLRNVVSATNTLGCGCFGPWTAKRSNTSILAEIKEEMSLVHKVHVTQADIFCSRHSERRPGEDAHAWNVEWQ